LEKDDNRESGMGDDLGLDNPKNREKIWLKDVTEAPGCSWRKLA
jgi:hypothetical protein